MSAPGYQTLRLGRDLERSADGDWMTKLHRCQFDPVRSSNGVQLDVNQFSISFSQVCS